MADAPCTGKIIPRSLNIRAEPVQTAPLVVTLNGGVLLTIIGSARETMPIAQSKRPERKGDVRQQRNVTQEIDDVEASESGRLWYRVLTPDGVEGWAVGEFLELSGDCAEILGSADQPAAADEATADVMLFPAPASQPVIRGYDPPLHPGIDYDVPVNTQLLAPAPGVIVASELCEKCTEDRPNFMAHGLNLGDTSALADAAWNYGYGHYVVVRFDYAALPDGVRGAIDQLPGTGAGYAFVIYAQLNQFLVKRGELVVPNQVIAHTGNSGNSSGPHLHVEVRISRESGSNWRQMTPIDPALLFANASGSVTPPPRPLRSQKLANDTAFGQDALGVEKDAYALADVLLLRDLTPPICVGILGGWGSGKSFFMDLMYKRMIQIRSRAIQHESPWSDEATKLYPQIGHVYLIRFDAWTYAKSNLWASLVQTLFLELNRQLSIESKLSGDGLDPLQGGELWQVLFSLPQSDMARLMDAEVLQRAVQVWQQERETTASDVLWTTLNAVQREHIENQKKLLQETQQQIAHSRAELQTAEAKLAAMEARDDTNLNNEALKQTLIQEFGLDTSLNMVSGRVQEALQEATQPIQPIQAFGLLLREAAARPAVGWRMIVIIVVALAVVLVGNTFLSEGIAQTAALLVAVIGGIANLGTVARPVFDLINKWNQKAQELHKNYQANQEKLYLEERAKLQQQITALQQTIEQQESLAKVVQKQAALTARYDSVTDFVVRRTEELLKSDLGILHEVQQDLGDLTHVFRQGDSREETVREQFREKFPRGPARVVLFIDDLDRCPPDKVVEVLEATQLLLKTELFIVVLALDIRYVTRALEKHYRGILNRRGQPNGLDYIEKIIQIPYRVRTVEPNAITGYLMDQMIVQAAETGHVDGAAQAESTSPAPAVPAPAAARTPAPVEKPLEAEVIQFTREEYNALEICLKQIPMTPRAIKRIVNVMKIMKIIWSQQTAPPLDVIRTTILFLALAERFPYLMLELFDALASEIGSSSAGLRDFVVNFEFPTYTPQDERDTHLLKAIVNHNDPQLLASTLLLSGIDISTFNLIRSFSFVGEVGYDDDDTPIDSDEPDMPTSTPVNVSSG